MTADGDSFGSPGNPITVTAITLSGDAGATIGTVVEIRSNAAAPVTIFTLRATRANTHTVLFKPARQFAEGIEIALSSSGGVPLNDDEVSLVLA